MKMPPGSCKSRFSSFQKNCQSKDFLPKRKRNNSNESKEKKKMVLFLLRLAVAAILLAHGGDSRPGDFRIIGPGGGGAMFHPTISPHDSNTVLVTCDMTGSYITHDAGKSWRTLNLGGVV